MRVATKLLDRLTMLSDDPALLAWLVKGVLSDLVLAALDELSLPHPSAPSPPSHMNLQIALLRLLRLLVVAFPKALTPHKPRLLQPVGALLLSSRNSHAAMIAAGATEAEGGGDGGTRGEGGVEGGGEGVGEGGQGAACDSDGGLLGSEAVVTQMFDLLAAIASSSRLYKLLLPALPELVFLLLSFLEIIPEAHAEWEVDVRQYLQAPSLPIASSSPSPRASHSPLYPHRCTPLASRKTSPILSDQTHLTPHVLPPSSTTLVYSLVSRHLPPSSPQTTYASPPPSAPFQQDEDDDSFAVSLRVATQQLLDELLESYGKPALAALCSAAQRRLQEAHALREVGPEPRPSKV